MKDSPLQKLRALPERKRNLIAISASAFVAVTVGFAQISYHLNENDQSSKVAQNAPSALDGLGSIVSEGKNMMTGAVGNWKAGIESVAGTSTIELLHATDTSMKADMKSDAPRQAPPVKKSIDISE